VPAKESGPFLQDLCLVRCQNVSAADAFFHRDKGHLQSKRLHESHRTL